MSAKSLVAGSVAVAALVIFGCHSATIDKAEFRSALNSYYSSRNDCLWPEPVKFPAQADTNNQSQTQSYDALTDAGLLQRTPEEKKRFLIGSKAVNDYDLSAQGRANWTADQSEPGYGNFCFGHPKVTTIDGFNPPQAGANEYTVSYHYGIDLPNWANTPEIKNAFPRAASESSGAAATATVIKVGDAWQVQNVNSAGRVDSTGYGLAELEKPEAPGARR
jgi:hypothetical protein